MLYTSRTSAWCKREYNTVDYDLQLTVPERVTVHRDRHMGLLIDAIDALYVPVRTSEIRNNNIIILFLWARKHVLLNTMPLEKLVKIV